MGLAGCAASHQQCPQPAAALAARTLRVSAWLAPRPCGTNRPPLRYSITAQTVRFWMHAAQTLMCISTMKQHMHLANKPHPMSNHPTCDTAIYSQAKHRGCRGTWPGQRPDVMACIAGSPWVSRQWQRCGRRQRGALLVSAAQVPTRCMLLVSQRFVSGQTARACCKAYPFQTTYISELLNTLPAIGKFL